MADKLEEELKKKSLKGSTHDPDYQKSLKDMNNAYDYTGQMSDYNLDIVARRDNGDLGFAARTRQKVEEEKKRRKK